MSKTKALLVLILFLPGCAMLQPQSDAELLERMAEAGCEVHQYKKSRNMTIVTCYEDHINDSKERHNRR